MSEYAPPAATSYAPEIAAASAADWSWRITAYHNPVSAPSPTNPIKTVAARATNTAVTPRLSWTNRCQNSLDEGADLFVTAQLHRLTVLVAGYLTRELANKSFTRLRNGDLRLRTRIESRRLWWRSSAALRPAYKLK